MAGLSNALAEPGHFGLARFTPHDLRRTAATHMTKTCGVSQLFVGEVLNREERHGDPMKYRMIQGGAEQMSRRGRQQHWKKFGNWFTTIRNLLKVFGNHGIAQAS